MVPEAVEGAAVVPAYQTMVEMALPELAEFYTSFTTT
jgi:hypothetical protein